MGLGCICLVLSTVANCIQSWKAVLNPVHPKNNPTPVITHEAQHCHQMESKSLYCFIKLIQQGCNENVSFVISRWQKCLHVKIWSNYRSSMQKVCSHTIDYVSLASSPACPSSFHRCCEYRSNRGEKTEDTTSGEGETHDNISEKYVKLLMLQWILNLRWLWFSSCKTWERRKGDVQQKQYADTNKQLQNFVQIIIIKVQSLAVV